MIWQDIFFDVVPTKAALIEACRLAFKVSLHEGSVYIYEESLVPTDAVFAVGVMCEALHSRALISDDSPNPSSMTLVRSPRDSERISVNPNEWDDIQPFALQ